MIHQGRELVTGIVKSPVSSPLFLSKTQLEGDGQADLVYHGGEDKALCVYASEHYPYWEKQLNKKLSFGSFGENLTVSGMLEDEVCIGDVFAIGEAVVQVSQPRQPCYKLAKRHDVVDLAVQVQDTGYTGFYFRVLQEGVIPPHPRVERIKKHELGVTLADANHVKYQDKSNISGIQRILSVEALSASWRESFENRLAELTV
ncbi:MOSC domain-containing protein [Paenibacillus aestuarii]|uniref:MOSC domain-containing protein n=1 Tax=Paenibacillus aestuarii TaxID=516965 RepID=A0ABW0KDL5_9BACL|nr:MOSC domain-containing protein [Paenibacillus aestuarii]